MAQDDLVITIVANASGGATADLQPGSGVEYMILSVGNNEQDGTAPWFVPSTSNLLINGTDNQSIMFEAAAGDQAGTFFAQNYVANNTSYFRFRDSAASTGDFSYAVITL